MGTVRLRPGHVQPVWAGHPWVFAQAIATVDGAPGPGDAVTVTDPGGRFLGRGYYEPKSAIPIRILSTDPDDALEGPFLARRIEEAARLRRDLDLPRETTSGFRLINGEGDRLPGLFVDVYGHVAVVQAVTVGMQRRMDDLLGPILRACGARVVLEARDKRLEGSAEGRLLRGTLPDALRFRENCVEYELPLEITQKTGFYFDQREHRDRFAALARGRSVLDIFSFVGPFGMNAALRGAKDVTCIESSAPAVAQGALLARKNGVAERTTFLRADVKRALPELAREGRRFDLVVCDPPKLAPTARHLDRSRAAYRKLNANALRLTEPTGFFVTCSCSAAMGAEEFLKIVAFAARDAGRRLTLLHLGREAPDHPTPPGFPQGRYLKTAFFRVLE